MQLPRRGLTANYWLWLLIIFGCLLVTTMSSANANAYPENQFATPPPLVAHVFETEQRMGIASVKDIDFNTLEVLGENDVMLLKPHLEYWFKVSLLPQQCHSQVCYLVSHNPSLLHVNYYAFKEGRLVDDEASGSMAPDSVRYLGVSMPLDGNQDYTVYVNVRSERKAYFGFDYKDELAFQQQLQSQWLMWFVFVGLMFGFLIYCAAMSTAYRSSIYGFLALYIASSTLLLLVQSGITKLVLPYVLHSFFLQYIGMLGSLAGVSILLFLSRVVHLERLNKVYQRGVNLLLCACCVLAIGSLFLPIWAQMEAMRLVVGIIILVAVVLSAQSKSQSGRDWLLIVSWLPYIIAYGAMVWLFVAPYSHGIYIHSMFAVATMANCVLIGIDCTVRERMALNKHKRSVYWDRGTGLPNKQLFYKALQRSKQRSLTLIMFKPKGLVEARANFGIEHADTYIQGLIAQTEFTLAGLPVLALSKEHNICRFSDDIFALALEGELEVSAIEQTVCVINGTFNEGVEIDNTHLIDQVDVGVANMPIHTHSKQQLTKLAMQALYRDKSTTQRWHMYSPEDCERSLNRLSLASDLRQAIDQQQFQIYLQPQIDLTSQKVYGAEVLLRWLHPQKGMISPAEFIPIAESAGLITEITEWVIAESIKTQALILQKYKEHIISINISGRDLSNKALPSHILSVLQDHDVPPGTIMLELTESSTIEGKNNAISILDEFRRIGVQIAIDDFGTGYSSLAYLSYLGFNELKIDKQFVSNIANSPKDQSICQSTCELAQSLQASVVAEGIEDVVEAQYMAGYGCQLGQGYYFAKPMPVDNYMSWVTFDHDFGLLTVLKSKSIG